MMEKERLEWIMSGLNRYQLAAREDQFVKSVEQDFNQKKYAHRTAGRKIRKSL
jgi:hypothetical protein